MSLRSRENPLSSRGGRPFSFGRRTPRHHRARARGRLRDVPCVREPRPPVGGGSGRGAARRQLPQSRRIDSARSRRARGIAHAGRRPNGGVCGDHSGMPRNGAPASREANLRPPADHARDRRGAFVGPRYLRRPPRRRATRTGVELRGHEAHFPRGALPSTRARRYPRIEPRCKARPILLFSFRASHRERPAPSFTSSEPAIHFIVPHRGYGRSALRRDAAEAAL
jgi:hypothetical protein